MTKKLKTITERCTWGPSGFCTGPLPMKSAVHGMYLWQEQQPWPSHRTHRVMSPVPFSSQPGTAQRQAFSHSASAGSSFCQLLMNQRLNKQRA